MSKEMPSTIKQTAIKLQVVPPTSKKEEQGWAEQLRRNKKDGSIKTNDTTNAELIIRNDPELQGLLSFDKFTQSIVLTKDIDDYHLDKNAVPEDISRVFQSIISKSYEVTFNSNILNPAILTVSHDHDFNPLIEHLEEAKKEWLAAGSPKVADKLFIDYLGAEDNELNIQKTRMALAGLIARALTPGIKFDYMTILYGPQGYGKTTLLQRLVGDEYYTDGLTDLTNKDSLMISMEAWLVNDDELDVTSNSSFSKVKKFITQRYDYLRIPYAYSVTKKPRSSALFGTTNKRDILLDKTGSRRYVIIECTPNCKKSVLPNKQKKETGFTAKEANLVLGEAYTRFTEDGDNWRALYWNNEETKAIEFDNAEFQPVDPLEEQIKQYLDMALPNNWNKLTPTDRSNYVFKMFNSNEVPKGDETNIRNTVSAKSIMTNLLGFKFDETKKGDYKRTENRVKVIMDNLDGWEHVKGTIRIDGLADRGWRRS